MNKNLIAVSAKIGGGKDTFFDILKKKTGMHYENKKFAWKLKEIAEKLTGIPALDFEKEAVKNSYLPDEWNYLDVQGNEQRLTCREFMQKLGTEGLRNGLHTNVWVNALFADYKSREDLLVGNYTSVVGYDKLTMFPNWFISDCRFENEAEALKKRGGLLIRINRFYSWEQFTKLYGLKNMTNNFNEKHPVSYWGDFLKSCPQTEEIETAIKKIFHSSETSLDNYSKFDYVIDNNGTLEEFEQNIEKCLEYLEIGNYNNATV